MGLKKIFSSLKSLLNKIFSGLIRKEAFFISLLILISIAVGRFFLFEPLQGRKLLSKIYKKNLKQTLQRVDGPLIEYGLDVRVLKVKKGNKLYLEFLSKQPDNSFIFINSIQLRGSRDGYFREWKEDPSSLWLADYTNDGRLDAAAPAFDKFFRPKPNLAVYNKKTKRFELEPLSDYPDIIPRPSKNF